MTHPQPSSSTASLSNPSSHSLQSIPPKPSPQQQYALANSSQSTLTNSPTQPPPHRHDTVSREVFLLTGGQTPTSFVPAVPTAGLSAVKPSRKRAWQWIPFCNSARRDALQLCHWAPVGSKQDDYTFARFNRKVKMVNCTEREYEQVVKGLMPLNVVKEGGEDSGKEAAEGMKEKGGMNHVPTQMPWSKEETDAVFRMCAEYDFRFVVIHDRWPSHLRERSVDEIKDRYYSVAKAIIEHRNMLKLDESGKSRLSLSIQKHCQSIIMNPFDYEYECIRKNQLEFQYHRSKEELREEEETVREARRIELNRKRTAKERTRLAKLLTPAGDIAMVDGAGRGLDPSKAVAAMSLPQKTFPHRKIVSGAFARSSMIYTPVTQSSRLSRRIDDALMELGVGTRPTPTSIVVDNFDLLRMEILHYIELQRTVMRKEEDVHLLRIKLAKLKNLPPPSPPVGVTLSHKKRKADEIETGLLFGAPPQKQQKVAR